MKIVVGSGLHFKVPFVDKVETYSARLYTYISDSEVVNTAEKKQYYVQTYAQWYIADPALFSLKLGSMARAVQRGGDTAKAKKCYRLAACKQLRPEAYIALARQEKRDGNAERAVKLYTAMLARNEKPVIACEGLAKLYEHVAILVG